MIGFAPVSPPDVPAADWQMYLRDLSDRLTAACRDVDPNSTDEMIEQASLRVDVVGEVR